MGYETINRRVHVMTRKNTLKSLPTDTEFRVVGLDLAKSDVSVAAIPVDDNTPSSVDRMTYADLLDWAGKNFADFVRDGAMQRLQLVVPTA